MNDIFYFFEHIDSQTRFLLLAVGLSLWLLESMMPFFKALIIGLITLRSIYHLP